LTKGLARRADIEIRALTRHAAIPPFDCVGNFVPIRGNLAEPSTLAELLRPGCSVANFAFDAAASREENLATAEALANGCITHRVKRVLHCSTAIVVGATSNKRVDELTECRSRSDYEKTKLAIESLLRKKARGRFELVILRPTAVFGPGGRNLLKMANDLTHGSRLLNQLRSFANGRRQLNLVAAENVAAAAIYLLGANAIDQEVFIISDDEAPANNYHDVERVFIDALAMPANPIGYKLPQSALSLLLRMRGRSLVYPDTRFSCDKLKRHGFEKPVKFDVALTEFISWYKLSRTGATNRG